MVTKTQLIDNLKSYIILQLDSISKDNPIISFLKPVLTRVLNNNFHKAENILNLIADSNGNIDIENIIPEMIQGLMNTNTFIVKLPLLEDVTIGNGNITFNIPMTNKKIVFNVEDLETLKEMLIVKN